MPTWGKWLFRTIGLMNLALAVYGAYLLIKMAAWSGAVIHRRDASAPYLGIAFVAIAAINWVFLVALCFTAAQLLRLKTDAVVHYLIIVATLFVYSGLNGALWRTGRGIGRSIAGATGIGNMGIAPFEFFFGIWFAYPFLSALLLFVLGRRFLSKAVPQTEMVSQ